MRNVLTPGDHSDDIANVVADLRRVLLDIAHAINTDEDLIEVAVVALDATGGVSTHPLLGSAVHTDTVDNPPVQGALISGTATPKWERFAKGLTDEVLTMDGSGTDLLWRKLVADNMGSTTGMGDVFVLQDTPILTTPTLVLPTILSFFLSQHDHEDTVGGGQLDAGAVFNAGLLPTARGGTNHGNWTAGSIIFAGAAGTLLDEDPTNFFWDNVNKRFEISDTGTAPPVAGIFTITSTDAAETRIRLKNSVDTANIGLNINANAAGFFALAHGSNHGGTRYGLTRDNMLLIEAQGGSAFVIGTGDATPIIFGANLVEKMRMTAAGELLVGLNSVPTAFSAANKFFADEAMAIVSDGGVAILTERTYGIGGSQLKLQRANGTEALPTAVVDNNIVGILSGDGYDGTNFRGGAVIQFVADENWSDGGPPFFGGRIVFSTVPNAGAGGLAERMRLTNGGLLGINTVDPQAFLHVVGPDGAAALPSTYVDAPTFIMQNNAAAGDAAILSLVSGTTGKVGILFGSNAAAGGDECSVIYDHSTGDLTVTAEDDIHIAPGLLNLVVVDGQLDILPNIVTPVILSANLINFTPAFTIDGFLVNVTGFNFKPTITITGAGSNAIRGLDISPTVNQNTAPGFSFFTLLFAGAILQTSSTNIPASTVTLFDDTLFQQTAAAAAIGASTLTTVNISHKLECATGGSIQLNSINALVHSPVIEADGTGIATILARNTVLINDINKLGTGTKNVPISYGINSLADLKNGDRNATLVMGSSFNDGVTWGIKGEGTAENALHGKTIVGGLGTLTGAPVLTFSAAATTISRATGSWLTDNFAVGQQILIRNTVFNDFSVTISALTSSLMTCLGFTNDFLVDQTTSAAVIHSHSEAPQARLHLVEPVADAEVFRQETAGANTDDNPGSRVTNHDETTTDATVTTITSTAIPANTSIVIETTIIARRTGGSAGTAEDTAAYKLLGTFKNVAGTATFVTSVAGALPPTYIDPDVVGHIYIAEDQSGWNAQYTISGGNVLTEVAGAINNNIAWHATQTTHRVSS